MPSFDTFRATRPNIRRAPVVGNGDVLSPQQVSQFNASQGMQRNAAFLESRQQQAPAPRQAPVSRYGQGVTPKVQPGIATTGKPIYHVQRPDGSLVPVAAISGDRALIDTGKHFVSPSTGKRFVTDPASATGMRDIGTEAEEIAAKAAEKAQQEAAKVAAKQTDEAQKLANAQKANEFLQQGRKYYLDRVTGEPKPLQSDEEFKAAQAEKGQKLQEAAATKTRRAQLAKLEFDFAQVNIKDKDLEDADEEVASAREGIAALRTQAGMPEADAYTKPFDEAELSTPQGAAYKVAEQKRKELADKAAARDALKQQIAEAKLRIEAPDAYAQLMAEKIKGETPEALDARENEQAAQIEATKAEIAAKQAKLDAEEQRLSQSLQIAQQRYNEAKTTGNPAILSTAGEALQEIEAQAQAFQEKSQAERDKINAEADEVNRDIGHLGIISTEKKRRQQSEHEQTVAAFEQAAPGMGREYQSLVDDGQKRAEALRTKYKGREESPEAKAAFDALQKDLTGKAEIIKGEVETRQKAKSANLEKLWNQFGVGQELGTATMRDWVADKSTDPEYDKLGGVSSMSANFKAKVKELGLDEKEARSYMETRRQLDWSSPLDPKKAEQSAELTRPLREKLGITDMLEPVRRLPNGAIIPNPVLGGDEEAFKKTIEAAEGTPEQKAEAMKLWPSYRRQYGEGLLSAFAKQSAFGEDFNEWRESGKAKSTDPVEQALQYQDEMKGRSIFRRWGDLIASNVTAGFMDVTQAALGSSAAVLGAVPGIGKGLSELAGANVENAASLVNTQDQLSNTGLAGSIAATIARMAPGVAATVGTGSMAGGMIFGAAQTTGSLYGDAYNTLRDQGKSHLEAWKASAPASLAAGAMTAGLTKLFPGGVTALANNPEARASVRAMMAGFLSSGKAIAKGALDEIPEEVIDEAMSQLAQGYAEGRNPDDVVRDFITGLPELVVASGLMGGGMQALKDRQDRRSGGQNAATTTPEGPLPEEVEGIKAAISAYAPTAPEAIQAMPAVIRKGPSGQLQSEITAKARASMGAIAGIASGDITKPSQLTETQMRALGVKLDKGGKLVPATSGQTAVAPLIYTRPDKAGVDQIVITDEARDWLKGALPDLTIGQSEAERINAIENPPVAPKVKKPRKPKADKPVAETGPVTQAPAPEAAPVPVEPQASGEAGAAEGSQMDKGALATAGGSSYAEFATVDDADAFAYAAKLRKSQTDKGSSKDAEAAGRIIDRLARKMGVDSSALRGVLVDYNVAVRAQAKAVREGESFYAPTLAEFMRAKQPQTDTKADISAAETAPTVGETAPAQMDTTPAKGGDLIARAEARMRGVIKSLAFENDKPKAKAAMKAIIDGLRRYNGHIPIVLTDDPNLDFAWLPKKGALAINPETAVARFATDATDAKNAAAQARQFFRHELIHKFVVEQLGNARVMDIWNQLPPEVQSQVQQAYSVRLLARGETPRILNQYSGGHEYYRAMLEAMKDGTMTEQVIGKDLADKWRKFLDDVLALLRDLRKQFASIKSESARNDLITQVDQDIKLVSDALDAFEKSISPDAEPAQATNAGAGSTSGKPVEGSSTTVANPVSINSEKESSGNDGIGSVYETVHNGKPKWAVQMSEKRGFGDYLFDTESEANKASEIERMNRESRAKSIAEAAAREQEQAAKKAAQEKEPRAYAKAAGMSQVSTDRAVSVLVQPASRRSQSAGKIYTGTKAEVAAQMVADGYMPQKRDGGFAFEQGDGDSIFKVTKIEHDFAAWLVSQNQAPEVAKPTAEAPTVDAAANEAATSPLNDLAPPTPAQQDAGNYTKGHFTIAGHEISIENPAGSKRRPEWPALKDHYGYFKGTNAKDGDHVDVFIKPGTPKDYAGPVHVVRQVKVENGKATGQFDEYKVMLGYPTAKEAAAAYRRNYERGWPGMQRMTTHTAEKFAEIKRRVFTVKPDEVPGVRESDQALAEVSSRPPSVEGVTESFPEQGAAPASANPATPSLGTTGKAIWQGWKNLTGMEVMPDEVVVGVDVHGGGVYAWSGDELMRSETNAKQGYALMRPATKAEIESVHDSIDRGGLQIEARKKTGATGMFPKVDGGKTAQVYHQATGKPLAEWLETDAGKKWLERDQETQRKVAEINARADTPATAEAKVEEQVQVVAATEGQRDAKEIKKEIMDNLESLLSKMPAIGKSADADMGIWSWQTEGALYTLKRLKKHRQGIEYVLIKGGNDVVTVFKGADYSETQAVQEAYKRITEELTPRGTPPVTFSIPGDGTFKLVPTRASLEEMLKRVRNMPTTFKPSIGGGPEGRAPAEAGSAKQVADKIYTAENLRSWVINAANGDKFATEVVEAFRDGKNYSQINLPAIEAEVQGLLSGESTGAEQAEPESAEAQPQFTAGVEESALNTPMMKQWRTLREPLDANTVLLVRLGDFYEAFGNDAKVLSEIVQVALTKRNGIPMAGIPHHSATGYIQKLVRSGKRVAIAETVGDIKPGVTTERKVTSITPETQASPEPESPEMAAEPESREVAPLQASLSTRSFPIAKWSKNDNLSNDFLGKTSWRSFRDGIENIDPAAKGGVSSRATNAGTKDAELIRLWRSGFTASPNSKEDARGGEHVIEFRNGRAYKQTHPETFGAKFSPETPDSLIWGTPLEYLQRWRLFNEIFDGADVRFEGVVMHPNGALSLQISQPIVNGEHPSLDQIKNTLGKAGWKNIAVNTWEKATSRGILLMTDAKPANFKVSGGVVVPVDVIVSLAQPEPLQATPTAPKVSTASAIQSFEAAFPTFSTYMNENQTPAARKEALRKIIKAENADVQAWRDFASLDPEQALPEDAEAIREAQELLPEMEKLAQAETVTGQPSISIPDLHAAFVTAKRQQGTDSPTIRAVFDAAKVKNPRLSRQEFVSAIRNGHYTGLVTLKDGQGSIQVGGKGAMTLLPITDAEIMDAADNATETPEAILEEWAATEDVPQEPLFASPTTSQNPNTNEINEIRQTLNTPPDVFPVPPERLSREAESLVRWATENGRIIDESAIRDATTRHDGLGGGEEHDVWLPSQAGGRVVKLTKGKLWGIQHSLARYLDTLAESNERFGDDIQLEGVVIRDGWPHILISQPFYEGGAASKKEIDAYFTDAGYGPFHNLDGMYTNDAGDLVYDAFGRNVFKLADGSIMPIDVQVKIANPEPLQASPTPRNVANQASNLPGARDAWDKLSQTYEDKELETASYQKIEAAVDEVISEQAGFDRLYNQIVGKMREGIVLSLEEDIARRMIARVLWIDGNDNPASRTKAKLLFMADMREASETARKLGSRVDKVETPQQRLDNAMRNILSPSSKMVRERLVNVWSGAEKLAAIKELKRRLASTQDTLQRERVQRELEKAQARKDQNEVMEELAREDDAKVDAILKRNGLTQADLFLSVDDRHAMQEAVLEMTRVHMGQQSPAHKKAIEMSVRGYSDNAISKASGLPLAEVSATAEHFRNVVAKQAIAKEVTGGGTFSKVVEQGKKLISWILQASPTAPKKPKPLGNLVAKGSPTAAAVAAQIQAILNASIPTKGQRNSMNLMAGSAKGKNGQNVKVLVPYDTSDWKQVYRVARELSTREATKLDKVYEYWINGILSGPQTHVVNTASNVLSTAWAYGPQWFAEATANVLIRNPNSPQLGEFKHVFAGFYKGIMPALRNFALAWSTEADPVEHQYLDKPVTAMFQGGNLDKVGGIRPSIGGTLGRIVRVPGRFLVAQDAFAKTLIMHAESAAMAYRLGKKQGLAGVALENFMASQIATHGSESWQHAFEKAVELTFQDENDITKAVEGVSNALKRAKVVGFLFKYLLPFVRTPTNIYRAGIRKAGGSAGMLLYRLGKSGYYAIQGNNNEFRSYREGKMVKDVSESVMAIVLWYFIMGMSEGDDDDNQKAIEITGSRPFGVANAGERASQLRQEGGSNLIIIRKNPLTGEKLDEPLRLPYGRYEPIALAVSTLVDGVREFKEWSRLKPQDKTTNALAGSISKHLIAQAKDKTFLQGISGFMDFLEDMGGKNLSLQDIAMKNLFNGAIPNLIRQPYRNSQDIISDYKKPGEVLGSTELARSLGIGEAKINEAGKPVQRGGNAVTRVMFPVPSAPSTSLFDSALKKWNASNPSQQWNPDPITKADYYVYDPKQGSQKGKHVLTNSREISLFETMIGLKFASLAARALVKEGYRPGQPVTPKMFEAIKDARTEAITKTRQRHPSEFRTSKP